MQSWRGSSAEQRCGPADERQRLNPPTLWCTVPPPKIKCLRWLHITRAVINYRGESGDIGPASIEYWACKKWNKCQGKVLAGLPKTTIIKERNGKREKQKERERSCLLSGRKKTVIRWQNLKVSSSVPATILYAESSQSETSYSLSCITTACYCGTWTTSVPPKKKMKKHGGVVERRQVQDGLWRQQKKTADASSFRPRKLHP